LLSELKEKEKFYRNKKEKHPKNFRKYQNREEVYVRLQVILMNLKGSIQASKEELKTKS
jgi:hypothetical protein